MAPAAEVRPRFDPAMPVVRQAARVSVEQSGRHGRRPRQSVLAMLALDAAEGECLVTPTLPVDCFDCGLALEVSVENLHGPPLIGDWGLCAFCGWPYLLGRLGWTAATLEMLAAIVPGTLGKIMERRRFIRGGRPFTPVIH